MIKIPNKSGMFVEITEKPMDFIQINRVTRNKRKDQVSVPETICRKDIISFRPWHKGANDTLKGDMTMVIMRGNPPAQVSKAEDEIVDEVKKIGNDSYILYVHESYDSFSNRMAGFVIPVEVSHKA